jgi:hypothetical protein
MDCCNEFGHCRQGRDCPVRRELAQQPALPPELPVWKQRLQSLASAGGYAGVIMVSIGGAVLAVHAWVRWWGPQ